VSESYPDGVTAEEVEHLRGLAKEELRKRLAALRRTLPLATRQQYAAAMTERLLAHEAFLGAERVLAYSALKFEMDPRAAVERAWSLGKTVAMPRTLAATRELVLHAYAEGDVLEEGRCRARPSWRPRRSTSCSFRGWVTTRAGSVSALARATTTGCYRD